MTTDTLRTEACPLCNGEGIDSGGVEPWGSPTPPYPCHLCVERKRRERAEAEVEKLKGLVMEAARKGDELLEPYRLRAEKAETLLKQIQAFAEALNPATEDSSAHQL